MASGGREAELSSDDEFLQSFKKKMRKKTKKKSIVISDSSESDSDLDRIGKKKVKPLHDESDENSDMDKHIQFHLDATNDSSGDNEDEKCAICLGKFTGQDIATPETCDHMFCFGCLREWCKNVNTCPIDRLKFHLMLIRRHGETKIYKRVSVDSSLDPVFILDYDPDSFVSSDVPLRCTFCGGLNDSEPLVPCPYCDKYFHLECLVQPLFSTTGFRSLCPDCYFSPNNIGSSNRYSLGARRYNSFALNSVNRAALQRVNKNRKRLIRYSLDRDVSSSDSDVDVISRHNLRYFEGPASTNCPIARKRRRTYNLQSSQLLIPAAGSESSRFAYLYGTSCPDNSDDENEDRYNSSENEQRIEPCPSNRNEIVNPNPIENFDVVGSILEGQNILERLDLLERHKDGSFTLGSSIRQSLNKNSTRTHESVGSSGDDSERLCRTISRPALPHTDSVTTKQSPLNPTQNSNSKYGETPQNNYTCTSSTSKERLVDYDTVNFSSRNIFGNSGNERYNNENTSSTAANKSYCGSSGDDIKKVSNCKESSKMHHSEDEVDIYSDIESVGDEEGTISTIEGVNDRISTMDMPFKDGSPLSNPDPASDSSENELVIDEDMAGEDDENRKDNTQSCKSKNRSDVENNLANESEESDSSDPSSVNEQQPTRKTPDITDEGSYMDSRSAADSQIEESSQGSCGVDGDKNCVEHDDRTNESEESKHETESVEDQSFLGDEKDSLDAERNDFEYKVKSNSLDKRRSESIKKHEITSDTDNQESYMDVADEDNSVDSSKPSPRAEVTTPCSTTSSKYCDEEMKQEQVEDQFDNSMSSGVQEFDCTKNKDNSEASYSSPVHANENAYASFSQVRENENSNCSFESSQHMLGDQEGMDTNDVSQAFSEDDKRDSSDMCQKSEDDQDECINDNADYPENAGTPCLDENIDGQIENSPSHNDACDSSDIDSKMDAALSDIKSCQTPQSEGECENEKPSNSESEEQKTNERISENDVDLGIEDISEAGSGDLDDDFAENLSYSETKQDYAERENSNYEFNNNDTERYSKSISKHLDDSKYQNSSQSNQSFEDREEGEIIDDKPSHRSGCKQDTKYDHYHDENEDFGESAPRMNISDLPRIPKIKRDRVKDTAPVELPIENKRTSVLGRVDLGGADISWKRLSKHTRERSYRDGRPKEERVLYRERESRKKEKKVSENEWRSESKSSSRRDNNKRQDSDKTRTEKDPRSRKPEKKENKLSDWEYSDRDKRSKSHKDKHKEKHKDKKETKHDKIKYFKSDTKGARDKSKDDDRFERELKFEKEQKFERVVYEKGKCKDKDHKIKHKEKKIEGKSIKDHGREKHKHTHMSDHFSEKQREREVRKIDDKIKIVVEQKDGRKDKSKHKDKKESKPDTKPIQIETRKKEMGRIPYTELTSIESKEIFAKGDSIIINVNFNRTNSPKDSNIDSTDSNYRDRKSEECEILDAISSNDKSKKLSEKVKSEGSTTKRPATPPERTKQVLSVSECYWQGGDDSDANSNSDKSMEEVTAEEENDTMESADLVEPDAFSNSFNSNDASEQEETNKDTIMEKEKTPEKAEKADNLFAKESETVSTPSKRKSPRSPSPPSPVDNDSYDPCEPTRSPSPPPVPPAPPLPVGNPKPPPSPELPPLPPEPEPVDAVHEENINHQASEFAAVSSVVSSSQPVIVNNQTPGANPISLPNVLLPPPSFLSHTSATTNSLTNLSPIIHQSNFNFQTNNHGNILFQPNHVQQVIRGIVPNQIHANTTIPPPPNPPPLPNMGSVPPPPPPPSAMALLSQVRHPQINVRPTLTPNTLLQNLTMGHSVTMPQIQMTHMHHIPPNFSTTLSNHQSPMMMPSQNQSMNLPVSIHNQVSRLIVNQNPMMNHSMALQNQNLVGKPLGTVLTHQSLNNSVPQKIDKAAAEKNEVIDMEVDSPYSPGDFSVDDSVCDYSPTCSPLPSVSPKNKDVFDSLLPTDHRTSDKRTHDAVGKADKTKHGETKNDSKRAKHEHRKHSVRMQVDGKNKHRKEQKVEKKLDDSQLKILDELPSSAVEMQVKEKFLKKLNRQERVVEEVKLALKPYYKSRDVTKEEYKDILRRSVPKICHNKSGEINPVKVKAFVENYIKKVKHGRKKDKKKSQKLS